MSGNSKIDWHRDSTTGVEWCVGVPYCERPADDAYQTLGVLVPAELSGPSDAAREAPVVMPVITEGYAAMAAPTENDLPALIEEARPFLDAGMVYVRAGCRGRRHGAPAGVTDLKAVVRWLRVHDEVPGNKGLVFAFGHSGGGAQTAVLGASGNSDLWVPYLEAIGACDESDAIAGAMCWNPVTSLGVADAAYEWMMGRFCREGAELKRSLKLAATYSDYLRKLGYEEDEYMQVLLDVATASLRNWLVDGQDREVGATWGWVTQSPAGPVVGDLAGFVRDRKRATKPVPAFDCDDLKSPENMLFGHDGDPLHFNADYVDFLGTSQSERVAMYDPLTYLLADGASSDVAPFWRVSTGLIQPDTALCTEVNLAEAARRCPATRDVRFQTVWDVAHVKAERRGTPEENVIRWIREVLGR